MRLIALLIILAVAVPPVAAKDDGPKKRAVLEVQERKRKKRSPGDKPRLRRSAVFAIEVERKLIKGIDKTTRYLKKTVDSLPRKSAQRLQMLEKILNLRMEQATYVRSEEERLYDKNGKCGIVAVARDRNLGLIVNDPLAIGNLL